MKAIVDYKAIKKYRDDVAKLTEVQTNKFTEEAVKELAARLLRKVVMRTPVGKYPLGSGKTGGSLRREWTVGEVTRDGNAYSVEIINPLIYAPYVEYGHRTRNHKGWVKGRFMLTISEQELKKDAPRILQNKLTRFIKDTIDGE